MNAVVKGNGVREKINELISATIIELYNERNARVLFLLSSIISFRHTLKYTCGIFRYFFFFEWERE